MLLQLSDILRILYRTVFSVIVGLGLRIYQNIITEFIGLKMHILKALSLMQVEKKVCVKWHREKL